jgi:acyl carrier protein
MRAQDGEEDGEPPQTEIEKALAAVWTEVLDVDPVRRNDNFFDLGGHSLSAVQITFKIRQTFHIDFPLRTFLEAPVLRAQAQQLQEKLLSQADATELERLMDEIEPTV